MDYVKVKSTGFLTLITNGAKRCARIAKAGARNFLGIRSPSEEARNTKEESRLKNRELHL